MSPPPPEPIYLEEGEEPVFCVLHAPAPERRRDRAVLLCSPFGWDEVSSYRPRHDWAIDLADAGYTVVRFDYPGTGDSAATPLDPRRVEAWTRTVAVAARFVRDAGGRRSLAVIGLGLGGLLALRAGAEGLAVDELVLWDVPARGGTVLRQLRAFARFDAAAPCPSGEQPELPAGSLMTGGFLLSPETQAEIEALDLGTLTFPETPLRRALLLDRDGARPDERVAQRLRILGVAVDRAAGAGYGDMTPEEPTAAVAPRDVFATVREWLEAPLPALGGSTPRDRTPRRTPHAAVAPAVRETAVEVPARDRRLLGVLAEPIGQRDGFTVVLLNAGGVRRIGPNRLWVEAARRWAAAGITSLRLDLEAIGDSEGDSNRYGDVAQLYIPGMTAQVRDALDVLEQRGLEPRFVLAGLCSGAYWALHAAVEDPRVSAAWMFNPRTFLYDPRVEQARSARRLRTLLRLSSWRRILRGEFSPSRLLGWARAGMGALVGVVLRSLPRRREDHRGAPAEPDWLDNAFSRLHARGVEGLLVFSDNEPLHEELEREGRLPAAGWPELALVEAGPCGHTFRPAWAQALFARTVDAALARERRRRTSDPAHTTVIPAKGAE